VRSIFAGGAGVNVIAVAGGTANVESERRKGIGEKVGVRAAWRRRKGNRIARQSMGRSIDLLADKREVGQSVMLDVVRSVEDLLRMVVHVRSERLARFGVTRCASK
jgi:hypothetical protein